MTNVIAHDPFPSGQSHLVSRARLASGSYRTGRVGSWHGGGSGIEARSGFGGGWWGSGGVTVRPSVAQWQKHMPGNWQAIRDFLGRRHPERWGDHRKEITEMKKQIAQLEAIH